MRMATTKIWAVKDSLSRVVNYASNPDKTIISDLENVILYATDNDKTEKEETITGYLPSISYFLPDLE